VRSILFQWDDVPTDFVLEDGTVRAPDEDRELVDAVEGELVLATFSVSPRATALNGRLERAKGGHGGHGGMGHWVIRFDEREQVRLGAFLSKLRSPPSSRSPSLRDSVRDIRLPSRFPSAPLPTGPDAMFLRVLVLDTEDSLDATFTELSAVGIVCESVQSANDARARVRAANFDAVLIRVEGEVDAALVRDLRDQRPQALVVGFGRAVLAREIVAWFAAGADDFLELPLRPAELAARLVGTLRKRRAKGSNVGAA
jgi:CheY-like chemotaxis protein